MPIAAAPSPAVAASAPTVLGTGSANGSGPTAAREAGPREEAAAPAAPRGPSMPGLNCDGSLRPARRSKLGPATVSAANGERARADAPPATEGSSVAAEELRPLDSVMAGSASYATPGGVFRRLSQKARRKAKKPRRAAPTTLPMTVPAIAPGESRSWAVWPLTMTPLPFGLLEELLPAAAAAVVAARDCDVVLDDITKVLEGAEEVMASIVAKVEETNVEDGSVAEEDLGGIADAYTVAITNVVRGVGVAEGTTNVVALLVMELGVSERLDVASGAELKEVGSDEAAGRDVEVREADVLRDVDDRELAANIAVVSGVDPLTGRTATVVPLERMLVAISEELKDVKPLGLALAVPEEALEVMGREIVAAAGRVNAVGIVRLDTLVDTVWRTVEGTVWVSADKIVAVDEVVSIEADSVLA